LDQPVKIGRSVARARAAPNNAIFDCKVLSRNHALLWYENGKVLNLIALHVQKVIHVYCHINSTKLCMFYVVQFMHECPLHMKILLFTLEHIFLTFTMYSVMCQPNMTFAFGCMYQPKHIRLTFTLIYTSAVSPNKFLSV
jgi:hypothetical protein